MKVLRVGRRVAGTVAMTIASVIGCMSPVAAVTGPTWQTPVSPGGVTAGSISTAALDAPTISCWNPGDCVAVGTYVDINGSDVLYVSTETAGTWSDATTLDQAPAGATQPASLSVSSLDCVSAGNCILAGTYFPESTNSSAVFVATEAAGVWGPASPLPGLAALDTGDDEQVDAVACASAGTCTVAGTFQTLSGSTPAFAASISDGTWSDAVALPAASDADSTAYVSVSGLSCPTAGACTLVGSYASTSGDYQVLLDNESSGTWGDPTSVTDVSSLNDYYAQGTAVWCASAGTCEFGGTYTDSSGDTQGFIAAESSGSVTGAEEIPGLGALNTGGRASVTSIGCATSGSCVVGGSYSPNGSDTEAFVEPISGGTPGTAALLPGWSTLNHLTGATTSTVSAVVCVTDGCAVGGTYATASGVQEVFGDTESSGTWATVGAPSDVPSADAANGSTVAAFACDGSLNCDLVGATTDSSGANLTYEVGESDATWSWTQLFAPTVTVHLSGDAGGSGLACWSEGNCEAVGWYEPTPTAEMPWVDLEVSGVWGVATALPISTTDRFVEPISLSCANESTCVVIADVSPTLSDGQNLQVTPRAIIESDGSWGPLTPISAVSHTYSFTPGLALTACAGGVCHVLVDGNLMSGSKKVGSEVAVASVIAGKLSPFMAVDTTFISGPNSPIMVPRIFTCASATHCVEADVLSSPYSYNFYSVVHYLSGGRWTTIGRLQGESLASAPLGVHERALTLNSASCTSSGFCVLVGSETQTVGSENVAIGVTLIDGRLSRPFVLKGFPASRLDESQASSVWCFGTRCVVTGLSYYAEPGSGHLSITVDALRGVAAARIGSVADTDVEDGFETACVGPTQCTLIVPSDDLTSNTVWHYAVLQGSHLTGQIAIPDSTDVAAIDGLSATPGGTYQMLMDEGTNTTSSPLLFQW